MTAFKRSVLQIATLTTNLLVMRWELLSAVMMFFASRVKIKLHQNSHYVMVLLCSSIVAGMSCWFVTGLMGITLSMENLHNFMDVSKGAFIYVMIQTPVGWSMP